MIHHDSSNPKKCQKEKPFFSEIQKNMPFLSFLGDCFVDISVLLLIFTRLPRPSPRNGPKRRPAVMLDMAVGGDSKVSQFDDANLPRHIPPAMGKIAIVSMHELSIIH